MKWVVYCLIVSSLFGAMNSGCLKDTCNKEPTFKHMEPVRTLTKSGNTLDLRLNVTPGQKLPIAYYHSVSISKASQDPFGKPWQNNFNLLQSFEASDTSFILRFLADSLINNQHSLGVHFIFPDRRNHIDCSHPGGADRYFLDINFLLTQSGNTFFVNDFSWKEKLSKGPY